MCGIGTPILASAISPRASVENIRGRAWHSVRQINVIEFMHMLLAGERARLRPVGRWVNDRVERGVARRVLLIAATVSDIRDTLVEGTSGILATAPPWNRPRWEPSKRRLAWPNGAQAKCISGAEPKRARGPNIDTILADELPHWDYPRDTWDTAFMTLRRGSDPKAMICTTPNTERRLDPDTLGADNRNHQGIDPRNSRHLAPEFIDEICRLYQGTRFHAQEIEGLLIDQPEGCWFANFNKSRTVTATAEYILGKPIIIAVDAGTSRHCGAVVIFQTTMLAKHHVKFSIIGDYLDVDQYSELNARAILERTMELCPGGVIEQVWLDPASLARTSIGPTAFNEFGRIFGERRTAYSPQAQIVDGLDQLEILLDHGDLLIHPRCEHLISAFGNYVRASLSGGEWAGFRPPTNRQRKT